MTQTLRGRRETVHAAIDRAKAAGTTVTFDVNYRSRLAAADDARPVLREIAERADVVFGGAEELVLWFPETDAAGAASRLLEGGARQVVLKDGAAGATLFDGGAPVIAPGFVIDVVDTVGAGDPVVR
ncbi:carbohydrate kinase family protein [Microbacterium dauci]|uniref:PfkB family carbohydrate kinase n=1 Tax=Microbacterium dauci TaxID=3048008 RepID=A0ABT6ZCZ7_9MICO|nr:PfkB family carbohydrate kinase [Microbacterium sp. LX3-4]MDJ1114040.1 PfkB family carbohydrate kinase [Microbacterium sp. LX3-4]